VVRKQDWAQFVSFTAVAAGLASVVRGRRRQALALLAVAAIGDAAGRRWSRGSPRPLPASLRWILAVPRPPGALRRALQPQRRERILELGPGLGQQAVQVAEWVGPDGRVDMLDVQQEMLDATASRAERNGVGNVVAALADASGRLPYDDGTFDAAYLSSVLGEIPDREETLRELHRVLKLGGRLIVAEVALDPDFIPAGRLRALGEEAGFHFDRRLGPPFAYHARFTKG
jgi:SAM-dependent methyltransferase